MCSRSLRTSSNHLRDLKIIEPYYVRTAIASAQTISERESCVHPPPGRWGSNTCDAVTSFPRRTPSQNSGTPAGPVSSASAASSPRTTSSGASFSPFTTSALFAKMGAAPCKTLYPLFLRQIRLGLSFTYSALLASWLQLISCFVSGDPSRPAPHPQKWALKPLTILYFFVFYFQSTRLTTSALLPYPDGAPYVYVLLRRSFILDVTNH